MNQIAEKNNLLEERFQSILDDSKNSIDLAAQLNLLLKDLEIGNDDLIDLTEVISMLPLRGFALEEAVERLKKLETKGVPLNDKRLFAIASTDLFVEKAQHVLTRRSKDLYRFGFIAILITLILLIGGASFIGFLIYQGIPQDVLGWTYIGENLVAANSTHALILRIFQATAFSALILVGVKYMIGLGRSFFHEAESLRQRRHALRFGRLYVYLKQGDVDLDKLQEAFQWNKEIYTSYLDMKPEVITETVIQKLIDIAAKSPADSLKAVSEAIITVSGKKK